MRDLPGFDMRFNFQGVHPGFRRLKLSVHPGYFYILDASKILQLNRQDVSRFRCSAFGVHPTFCSSNFRMRPGFWGLKLRVSPTFCSLTFRMHPTFYSVHSGWNMVFWCLTFRVHPTFCSLTFRVHPSFWSLKFGVHPIFCSLTFRMHSSFCSLKFRVHHGFSSLTFRMHPVFSFIILRVHPWFAKTFRVLRALSTLYMDMYSDTRGVHVHPVHPGWIRPWVQKTSWRRSKMISNASFAYRIKKGRQNSF